MSLHHAQAPDVWSEAGQGGRLCYIASKMLWFRGDLVNDGMEACERWRLAPGCRVAPCLQPRSKLRLGLRRRRRVARSPEQVKHQANVVLRLPGPTPRHFHVAN